MKGMDTSSTTGRDNEAESGFVGAVQTFVDLINCHVHAIVSEGMFKRDGSFIRVFKVDMERCTAAWRERVFYLLLQENKIDEDAGYGMPL